MRLNKLRLTDLKKELSNRKKYLDDNNKFCFKDKRYKALLNEYERRVMKMNYRSDSR